MSDENIFEVFNKRIYTLAQLGRDLRRVHWMTGADVWLRRRLDPRTREAVMLAVSHVHNCRYCTFIHREWALHTGLSLAVITGIEASQDGDPSRADLPPGDSRWLATTYAQALVSADFGPVAPLLETAVAVEISAHDRRRIETVARIMTILNRSTNTYDALCSRLAGRPVDNSRLPDELVVSLFGWLVTIPMFLIMATVRRESPRTALRRFRRTGRR